jgi:hypothetical protein
VVGWNWYGSISIPLVYSYWRTNVTRRRLGNDYE